MIQAHIRQGNKAQSIEGVPRAKQCACVLFSALLAFSLMPTGAFQPASAYANEADVEVAAEGAEGTVTDAQDDVVAQAEDASGEDAIAEDAANVEADAPGDEGIEGVEANAEDDTAIVATEGSIETTESTEDAGIAAQSDVGVGIYVQGTIRFSGAIGPDPDNSGFNKYDDTFDRESTNKVCIDRSAFNGYSFASMRVEPGWGEGQDAAREAWEKIPAREKYTPEHLHIGFEGENGIVNVANESFTYEDDPDNPSAARVNMVFDATNGSGPGVAIMHVDYYFTDEATSATYEAHMSLPVYVQDSPNTVTGITVPSSTVTTWLDDTFNPPSSTGKYVYYYQYDGGNSSHKSQEFTVSVLTDNGNPAKYRFEELFDISIADESVITAVYNTHWENPDSGLVNGPDALTYGLNFVAAKAGTTNITIKLRQDPAKSVTFAVEVRTDHPEVSVPASFDMTMDESQRIYVEDEATTSSDASPITVPELGEQLCWYASDAKPFITSITSSNEDVLSVQRITSPSYWVSFAPFELVPVSAGTAMLTVTDCYGKTYTSTVTVNPSSSVDPGVTVNSVELVRAEDWESVSKGAVTMNIGDPDGVKLAADIDANGAVTTNWTSSNPEVAEVVVTQDANGDEICQVKPVRASYDEQNKTTADCRITVTVNGSVSDYCNITVEPVEDLCGANPSSPLGAATVSVSKAMPADVLQELQSVSLAISSIATGDQPGVDSASSALEKNGAKLAGVFDIHFVNKGDGSAHDWNKPDYPITVKIPMTASMKELHKFGTLSFYHVDPATGERTKMPTWVDANQEFVCFETTHFSPFILAAEPEEQTEDPKDDNGETTKPDDADKGDSDNTDKVDSDKDDSNEADSDKTDMTGDGNSEDNETASDEETSASMPPKTGDDGYALVVLALVAAAASLTLFALSRPRDRKASGRAQGHWQKQDGAAGAGCRLQGFLPCQKRFAFQPSVPKPSLRSFYPRA